MQHIHKKTNTLCFDEGDLKHLFESPLRARLAEEVFKRGLSPEELGANPDLMQSIVDSIEVFSSKEDIEIFSAVYMYLNFYQKNSKVCFKLKDSFNPEKQYVDTLEKLKLAIKENDLTDFLIMSDDGCRAFQLKTFTGETDLDNLFDLINKKLKHYAYDLGDVNLLITMQSKGDIPDNFFEGLHSRLHDLPIKGEGCILVSYNENNTFDVMNTVYPRLTTTRLEHSQFNRVV
ncbi:MAG: hypothetical protein RLZZ480_833 [Candidatus Parcubacteria bacterium]|jgi:hypothetical protein